jgi:antitoxin VapB
MGLNIKNAEVERLAKEVAELAHETKTEAVRKALLERRDKLQVHVGGKARRESLLEFMEREIWPQIPPELLGRGITREEREEILGIGPDGY